MSVIKAVRLSKTFKTPVRVNVFSGINLEIKEGESAAIIGPSGIGKSTLLQILGTLDDPTTGELFIDGTSTKSSNVNELRQNTIGFVFQNYNLFDDMSAIDNVLMPSKIARRSNMHERAADLLEQVGMGHRCDFPVKLLSGGEKQRVAIARALQNHPKILIADEPTGNLDKEHSLEVEKLLLEQCKKHNCALIVATHDQNFAKRCETLINLEELNS
ncbi:MAG: ABC transporter ATP-binding protein [Simkaniaceae bacterium]|nr:ABC transporter ATP-binding protein [Simkaniaceae bacterium]